MLISHRKRFIYTKTVKTAGTSVESFFEPYCMRDGEWSFSHARREYVSEAGIVGIRSGEPLEIQGALWWNHMPARTIRALIGETIWNDYFKFCVVRNPFNALVSAYRFFWESKQPPRPRGLFERLSSRSGRAAALADLRAGFEHWLRSVQLPIDRNKYCIDGELCVDHVIRYEALLDGIRDVCQRLAIDYQPEALPHLKKSEKSAVPVESYFTPASVQMVEQAYQFELQTFGYGRPWEHSGRVIAAA
jgi:sulfotransferase famil protein